MPARCGCDGTNCAPNIRSCGKEDAGWICTRPIDHLGPHIACGADNHNLHTWMNEYEAKACIDSALDYLYYALEAKDLKTPNRALIKQCIEMLNEAKN